MYKGKIDKLINEINKIARLKRISYKLENIYEKYDEFIEDYYFMEWLRISQDGITQVEELNNIHFFQHISSCLTIRFRQHFNDLFSVSEPTFAGFIV